MKNKILSVLLALTLIMGLMPTISFGAAVDGSVVFYNAATNEQIAEFDAESSIFAKVNFIAPKTGTANIVVANYNGKSLVGCNPIATLDMTAGEEVSYTTAAISAKNSNKIKVFAWDGMGTMEPLINNQGEIKLAAPNVGGGSGAEVGGDVVSEEVNLTDGNVSAQVPEGVQLANGATALVLSTQTLSESASDIEAGENEELQSIDIHIDGVSSENNVPIIVTVDNFAQEGFNKGNISLYHVEADGTKEMTEVSSLDELTAHNTYTYNPETGTLTMAIASFSEIALLSDTVNAWNGVIDTELRGEGTETSPYIIANADELAGMNDLVSNDNENYGNKYYKLTSDINIGSDENYTTNGKKVLFYPIGYLKQGDGTNSAGENEWYTYGGSFSGVFDGNGNTISGIYQNTWVLDGDYDNGYYNDAMGLFGYVDGGTVKNLIVDDFYSEGEFAVTGCVAAFASNATFENISLTNCHPATYNTGVGGIVGMNGRTSDKEDITFNNITVDRSNKISALWGTYDCGAGGIMGMLRGNENNTVTFNNCHVSAIMDVYNDVCANYQYYWYRYCGMFIGSVRKHTTDGNGYTIPNLDKITATNCTYKIGDWNNYWYCELVANSLASYTHDHQFSRLTEIDDVTEIQDENGNWTTTGNFMVWENKTGTGVDDAVCYHIMKDAEGNLYEHKHTDSGVEDFDLNGDGELNDLKEDRQRYFIPFNQLFTGYGWGVKAIYEFEGITDEGLENSVEKFESKDRTSFTPDETVSVGDLFSAVNGVNISSGTVQVYVSPVGEESTVSGVYSAEAADWYNGTLTFSGEGNAKVTITDYCYCTPTVIYVTVGEATAEEPVEKFKAKQNLTFPHTIEGGTINKTLGDIFTVANDDVTIYDAKVAVTIDNTAVCTYTPNTEDWTQSKLAFTGTGTVNFTITDNNLCNVATAEVNVTEPTEETDKFVTKFENTAKYLYRVGNATGSTVKLGTMFDTLVEGAEVGTVSVTFENIAGDAYGTYTPGTAWTDGYIQFTGTGVVCVTIDDNMYSNALPLTLEVVDAKNITSATGTTSGGNFALLCDVNASSYVYYWNSTLYGNGFTYSLNGAPTSYSSSHGHGVLITKNATLDNVVIKGDVYNSYGAYTNQDYYNSAVDAMGGDTIIQNCYISGCAAPVIARSNVTIKNTTLYGGTVANLIMKSGTVTLEDVTTANYDDGRSLVGMGIVAHSDATESAKLILNGNLTQYNFISESKVPTDTYAMKIYETMFGEGCAKYHFGTSPNRYVNTGIVSLTALFNADDITDNANTGYVGTGVTVSGVDGYVYTQRNTTGSVNNNYPEYFPSTQGAVSPVCSFDYTNKNYVAKTDGSNDYCYEENGKVNISMDAGDTFNWDTSILTVTKVGENLPYTVTMNGTDYTGKSIAFNAADDYEVIYTYTDEHNYELNEDGSIDNYEVTYTKKVDITVAVVEAATKHAEFTFGSSDTASTTVTVGNNTYVMPNVSATSSTIGSTTVSGQTIYYPIVEIVMSDKKTSHTSAWYAYFPVFSGAVTITDYKDNGLGDAETFGSSTQSMPSGLSIVGDPAQLFKYQSSSTAGTSPVVKNNILVYSSPSISAKRSEYNTVIQYTYQDNAGTTYYYYIGYHAPAQSYTSCVTPDTLVTLADGSQKRIDELTHDDILKVWDFEKGEYTTAPIAVIRNHGLSKNTVITLEFSDGIVTKVVNEHGYYNKDLKKFVAINGSNAQEYIGHSFVKENNGLYETVVLENATVETKDIEAWSLLTAGHYNFITDGIFSISSSVRGLEYLSPFEHDDSLKIDEAKKQQDIEKYGLYTYEDFDGILTKEQFDALNMSQIKVSVGKGIITWEDLMYIIEIEVFSPEGI